MIGEVPDDPDYSSFKQMLLNGSLHCKIFNENLKLKMSQRLDGVLSGMAFEPIDEIFLNRLAEHMGVSRDQIVVHGDNVTVNYALKPVLDDIVLTAVIMPGGSSIEFEPAPR